MGSFANGYPQGGGMNQGQNQPLSQRMLQAKLAPGQQPVQAGAPSPEPMAPPPALPIATGGGQLPTATLPQSPAATLAGLNLPGSSNPAAAAAMRPAPLPEQPQTLPVTTPPAAGGLPNMTSKANTPAPPGAPASFLAPVGRMANGGANIPNMPTPGNKANDTPAVPGNPITRSRGSMLAGLNRL